MADHPEPTLDDMLRTLAAARLILPPEVISLQAPPNLSATATAPISPPGSTTGAASRP